MEGLLRYIEQVDQSVSDAEVNVLESLISTYDKSIKIIQEADEDTDLSVFNIFQEGEKWDKFKEDTKAPVLGNKGENIIKRILMIIPRLIQKLIALIKKMHAKNRYKRLIRKIKSLEYSYSENKWSIAIKGRLTKKHIADIMKSLGDPEFQNIARKKSKLVTTEAALIMESNKRHDPTREIGSVIVSSKNKYVSPEGYIDTDTLEASDVEKILKIINKYERQNLIDVTYYMLTKHQIRSHYNYDGYITYLKEYLKALNEFRDHSDKTPEQCDAQIKKLQGITYEYTRGDSNHLGPNPFYSESLSNAYSLQAFSDKLLEIKELTDAARRDETYKYLLEKCHDKTVYSSPEEGSLLRELSNTIDFTFKSTFAFDKDFDEMDDYCTLTAWFMDHITELYGRNGLL